jgi:hypothetical protein
MSAACAWGRRRTVAEADAGKPAEAAQVRAGVRGQINDNSPDSGI